MKKIKRVFFVCALIMCVVAVLFYGFIPELNMSLGDNVKYYLQLSCSIMPTAIAIITAIAAPSFVAKALPEKRLKSFRNWSVASMLLLTSAFVMNICMNFIVGYAGAYYCAAICAVMFVLSYPKPGKLTDIQDETTQEK